MMKPLDQQASEEILVAKSPLLQAVFSGTGETTGELEEEYEIERRYLPSKKTGILTEEQLLALPDAHAREIEQVYVFAKTPDGKTQRFRLRRTQMRGGTATENRVFRIAYKEHVNGNPNARHERQLKLDPDAVEREADPVKRAELIEELRQFEELWKQGVGHMKRTRYYSQWPNCEIHYEVNREPDHLKGFVRIEAEFHDAALEKAAGEDKRAHLPEFVGRDVTDDDRYKTNSLVKKGIPPRGLKLMANLYERLLVPKE